MIEEEKFKDIEDEYFPSSTKWGKFVKYRRSVSALEYNLDILESFDRGRKGRRWEQYWYIVLVLLSRFSFASYFPYNGKSLLTISMDFAEAQFRFLFFLPRRLSIENESFLKRNWLGTSFLRNLFVLDMGRNLNFYRNC